MTLRQFKVGLLTKRHVYRSYEHVKTYKGEAGGEPFLQSATRFMSGLLLSALRRTCRCIYRATMAWQEKKKINKKKNCTINARW